MCILLQQDNSKKRRKIGCMCTRARLNGEFRPAHAAKNQRLGFAAFSLTYSADRVKPFEPKYRSDAGPSANSANKFSSSIRSKLARMIRLAASVRTSARLT